MAKVSTDLEVGTARRPSRSLSITIAAASPRTEAWNVRNWRKLVAVVLEQRLGAREVERHRHDVGAHDLRRARANRPRATISEFSIAARVRVENSWSRPRSSVMLATIATRIAGTAAMTENRPTMRTCSRAPARPRAAGLHDLPDFAPDDGKQQHHGRGVDQQQRDHDVVGRRDRRQTGEHHEGDEGRQQSQPDRDRPEDAGLAARGGRVGERRFRR